MYRPVCSKDKHYKTVLFFSIFNLKVSSRYVSTRRDLCSFLSTAFGQMPRGEEGSLFSFLRPWVQTRQKIVTECRVYLGKFLPRSYRTKLVRTITTARNKEVSQSLLSLSERSEKTKSNRLWVTRSSTNHYRIIWYCFRQTPLYTASASVFSSGAGDQSVVVCSSKATM